MSILKKACIPAYNEQNLIADVIRRTKTFVDKVVVYDDGFNNADCVIITNNHKSYLKLD